MQGAQGIEIDYANQCVRALVGAWVLMMQSPAKEILEKSAYGKGDTYGYDSKPEIYIVGKLRRYDKHVIVVTEEEGSQKELRNRWPTDSAPDLQPMMYFSDPMDRSKYFAMFIRAISEGKDIKKVGELMRYCKSEQLWEEMFEAPVSITGATSSITCVRKGAIIFSVILNYITRTLYVAFSSGIFSFRLPAYTNPEVNEINFEHVIRNGNSLLFLEEGCCPSYDDKKRFATFLGKEGYQENFDGSMLFVENPLDYLHHREPGGPSRVLYLSELQKGYGPVGFVMANGEKIGEWIHWLAFARFARNSHGGRVLRVYEIAIKRPFTKNDILMSTAPPYSIFSIDDNGCAYLDAGQLRNFSNPSLFRSMIVVVPYWNDAIIHLMKTHCYRRIDL